MATFPPEVLADMFDAAVLETTARVVPAWARWTRPEYDVKIRELISLIYQHLPRVVAYLKKNLGKASEKQRLEVAAKAAQLTVERYDIYWARRSGIWEKYPQGNLSAFGKKNDDVEARVKVVGAREGGHQKRAAEIASKSRPTRPLLFARGRLRYLLSPVEEKSKSRKPRDRKPTNGMSEFTNTGLKIPIDGENYQLKYHGSRLDDYVLEHDGRQWYRTEQMAVKFGVTVRTIANWAQKGVLPATKSKLRARSLDNRMKMWSEWRFPKAEIDEFGDARVNSHYLYRFFSGPQFAEAVGLSPSALEKRMTKINKSHLRLTTGQRRRLIVMEEMGVTDVELTRWIGEQIRSRRESDGQD